MLYRVNEHQVSEIQVSVCADLSTSSPERFFGAVSQPNGSSMK